MLNVECRVQSVECRVQSVECRVLTSELFENPVAMQSKRAGTGHSAQMNSSYICFQSYFLDISITSLIRNPLLYYFFIFFKIYLA